MSYINITIPPFPSFLVSGDATYRPGDTHPRRLSLPCFDIIIVEQGELFICAQNKQYTIEKNCALIIPPETSHYSHRVCTQKTIFHWLHFVTHGSYTISESARSTTKQSRRKSVYDVQQNIISFPVFQSLKEDMANRAIAAAKMLETVSFDFFEKSQFAVKSKVNLFYQEEVLMQLLNILSVIPEDSKTNDIAYQCMQYISAHYAEPIQLSTLAKIANCHHTHVIRCMKKEYGKTPTQLVNQVRLQRACELLKTKNLSITTISYTIGFSSPAYFCKQFKSMYGTPPPQISRNNYIKHNKKSESSTLSDFLITPLQLHCYGKSTDKTKKFV